MPEPSKAPGIINCRCPRCRKGEVFTHSAVNILKFDRMHPQCAVCGLHYEVEVGLFYGAMYISYGISVNIVLLVGVLLYYLASDPPTWVYLSVVAGIIFLSTPLLFRYSRILMLYFFSGIRYRSSCSNP